MRFSYHIVVLSQTDKAECFQMESLWRKRISWLCDGTFSERNGSFGGFDLNRERRYFFVFKNKNWLSNKSIYDLIYSEINS